MKRLLALFLIIVVVFVAAPPPDLIIHYLSDHVSITSLAIAAPSYTLNEWLALRKYSRAEWYRMKARRETPDVIGEGRMQRITPDADARWLKRASAKSKNRIHS